MTMSEIRGRIDVLFEQLAAEGYAGHQERANARHRPTHVRRRAQDYTEWAVFFILRIRHRQVLQRAIGASTDFDS
jgi:membrane carboxypeptidase/penicillin-binding protein